MNTGTAKPSPEELRQVKHHFINSLSVTDDYNVGMFERDAIRVLEKLFEKKKTVVMAGGSGLYINAVCNGFDAVPEADTKLREHLSAEYREDGIQTLQRMLKKLDPEHYRKVDIKNPHRLIRAIEVCMVTGKKYSEILGNNGNTGNKGNKKRNFGIIKIGMNMGREELYDRINKRVDEMMKNGLLEEVRSLSEYKHRNSLQTVGYKELFDYYDGNCEYARAIELIKQNTRNFAKRQMTWFRKDKEITWFEAGKKDKIIEYIKTEVERLSGKNGS